MAPEPGIVDQPSIVLMLLQPLRFLEAPKGRELLAVEEHHGRFLVVDAEDRGLAHGRIEEFGGVGEIDLVNIVVDRPALVTGQRRNGIAIVGKPGLPLASVEAFEILHEVDLVAATGVAVLFHGPDKHPLRPVLGGLRAQVDAHRRLFRGGDAGVRVQGHEHRGLAIAGAAHALHAEGPAKGLMVGARFEFAFCRCFHRRSSFSCVTS